MLSLCELIDIGLHDSVITDIFFDFIQKEVKIRVIFSDNSIFILNLYNVKSVQGITFDNKNKVIVLDYIILENKLEIFTTMSEWIKIDYDKIDIWRDTIKVQYNNTVK